jgi:phosphonate transport system substrate-binding protein
MKRVLAFLMALTMVLAVGCSSSGKQQEPQTKQPAAKQEEAKKPETLTIGFVPSQDAAGIETKVKPMEDYLSKQLGMPVKAFVGANYVAVVEAMGANKVDVAFLNTLSYVMANGDYGAQVILKTQRQGRDKYRAQLTVRKEDNIPVCDPAKDPKCTATFQALKGRKLAFVDAASTSGYLYPVSFMKSAGVDPEKGKWFSDVIMAGGHDAAVKAVYNKVVDAAWSFEDARDTLTKELPDVKEKLAVVAYTEWIPNDTVTVRKGLPADFVAQIKQALLDFIKTNEGKDTLTKLYSIDGFTEGNDKDYDVVRAMAKNLGLDIKAELTRPKK